MTTRRCVLALALACLLLSAVPAQADIDPASDVLLIQTVFLPYQPKACSKVSDALVKLTRDARKAGYPVRVAVIGSRADLGGIAKLYGKPQAYADFLGGELVAYGAELGQRIKHDPVLAVMSQGYGVHNGGRGARATVKTLSKPQGSDPNSLVRSAVAAIPKLAAADGHSVDAPKLSAGCASGAGNKLIVIGVLAVVLAVGSSLIVVSLRRRDRDLG
jgi:hypothetical protein